MEEKEAGDPAEEMILAGEEADIQATLRISILITGATKKKAAHIQKVTFIAKRITRKRVIEITAVTEKTEGMLQEEDFREKRGRVIVLITVLKGNSAKEVLHIS